MNWPFLRIVTVCMTKIHPDFQHRSHWLRTIFMPCIHVHLQATTPISTCVHSFFARWHSSSMVVLILSDFITVNWMRLNIVNKSFQSDTNTKVLFNQTLLSSSEKSILINLLANLVLLTDKSVRVLYTVYAWIDRLSNNATSQWWDEFFLCVLLWFSHWLRFFCETPFSSFNINRRHETSDVRFVQNHHYERIACGNVRNNINTHWRLIKLFAAPNPSRCVSKYSP